MNAEEIECSPTPQLVEAFWLKEIALHLAYQTNQGNIRNALLERQTIALESIASLAKEW